MDTVPEMSPRSNSPLGGFSEKKRGNPKGDAVKKWWTILIIPLVSLSLSCSFSVNLGTPTETAALTSIPAVSIETVITPTFANSLPATWTPQPTYTPLPTYTPYPTMTASPTMPTLALPTASARHTTAQVIAAFKAAGLEAENPTAMGPGDFGLAPMTTDRAVHFLVPSLCGDCGGRVFDFDKLEDLNVTKTYYVELGRGSAAFYSWVFVKDNILVQINGELPEDQARKYEVVLKGL
jgi:hypothetical protein